MQSIKYSRFPSARGVCHVCSFLVSSCLVATICTAVAVAQSPVAYVYVAQTPQTTSESYDTQPIYAYQVTADGKATPIEGSPFTQISGEMVGTNGTHFITLGYGGDQNFGPLNYLFSYDVASNGAIGKQVSEINTQLYSGGTCPVNDGQYPASGAELDHTGQYLYVPYCGDAVQTYKIAKSTGDLTFQSATIYNPPFMSDSGLPKLSGNSAFAYNQTIIEQGPSEDPGYFDGFAAFARESDGSLEWRGVPTVTGPSLPENDYPDFTGVLTDDPTNHFAVLLGIGKFIPPDTWAGAFIGCALASYTMGTDGQLTSTNTYDNMPRLPACGQEMLLSPNGKVLAVLSNGGGSLQFLHFNGAEPITPFTAVASASGDYFGTMAWDASNHLYALNSFSGKLHVYTVNSTDVVEAHGSPYDLPPHCPYDYPDSQWECGQSLIVRIVP
jgi:hypothetical protein